MMSTLYLQESTLTRYATSVPITTFVENFKFFKSRQSKKIEKVNANTAISSTGIGAGSFALNL